MKNNKKNKKVSIFKCMLLFFEIILIIIFVYAFLNVFLYNNFYIINAIFFFASSTSLLLLSTIVNWKIFEKSGRKGWYSLIPIYNLFIKTKISIDNGWLCLLYLIPIVNIIFSLIVNYKLSKAFSKNNVFSLFGSVFCLLTMSSIICDDSQYILNDVETKDTTKRDKIVFIIVSIFIIMAFVPCLWAEKLQERNNINNNSNHNNNNNDTTYFSVNENAINFECSIINPTIENYGGDTTIYGVNDYVYCNIKTNNDYKITYMELEYNYGTNIDLENIYSLSDSWNIDKNLGNIEINLLNEESDISDVYFKFYIKDNKGIKENYKITIENIKFISNNNNYKINEDKLIELKTSDNRIVQINEVLKFDELTSDGTFKTMSEYKCNDDLCMVNPAVQGFIYSNNNTDIVMIYDGEHKILYDVRKGTIINTYGINSIWLSSKNQSDEGPGTYIYIQAKDSDKYGIIDVNGNIIKKFDLEKLPFVYFKIPSTLRYSLENNMFVNIKNGKYGIIEITSDKIIIDYVYEDLNLINEKYFKAKLDGKWYIYGIDTNQKFIEEGFDEIHYNSDDVLIVEKDNVLYIKNYENQNIIEDTIKINKGNTISAYLDYVNSNIININICNDEYCYEIKESYDYNIDRNKLSKVK